MKIGSKPPSLPSLADVAVVPDGLTGGIPAPHPNVGNGRVPDSFTPGSGVERRYSVQFLKGLEGRLQLAGLGNEFASELKRHMSTLDRSGVDREGRVVDSLLTGAHPKESLHLYELTSKLTALVTPGGVRAEANRMGSWTIRPPEGEPVELKPGASLQLPGGVTLKASSDVLQASGAFTAKLHPHGADVAKLLDPATMAVALGLSSLTPMAPGAAKAGVELLESVVEIGLSIGKYQLTSEVKEHLELTAEVKENLARVDSEVAALMMELQKLQRRETTEDRKYLGATQQSVTENLGAAAGKLSELRSAIGLVSGAAEGATAGQSAMEPMLGLVRNLKAVLNLTETFAAGTTELAGGALSKGAAQLESALGDALPVVLNFVGGFLGLSGVGAKTGGAIRKTSEEVERMLGNALGTLVASSRPVREQLTALLTQAGQSAAPSRRADPAAEKAVLLLEVARRAPELAGNTAEQTLGELKQLADRIRGQPRDFVLGPRFR